MDREAIGSWLSGPRSATGVQYGYPGQRLGRPEHGPGSVVTFGGRLRAFVYDALLCDGAALGLHQLAGSFSFGELVFWVFFAEVLVLSAFGGQSAGQRVAGVRVVPVDSRSLGLWRPIVRTVLLMLVVPALIWDRDGRGLHDKAVGTVLVHQR
ncbi:MAG: RDD family protein [Actinomycetes bacterium]